MIYRQIKTFPTDQIIICSYVNLLNICFLINCIIKNTYTFRMIKKFVKISNFFERKFICA